jgi:hypothetical protein
VPLRTGDYMLGGTNRSQSPTALGMKVSPRRCRQKKNPTLVDHETVCSEPPHLTGRAHTTPVKRSGDDQALPDPRGDLSWLVLFYGTYPSYRVFVIFSRKIFFRVDGRALLSGHFFSVKKKFFFSDQAGRARSPRNPNPKSTGAPGQKKKFSIGPSGRPGRPKP